MYLCTQNTMNMKNKSLLLSFFSVLLSVSLYAENEIDRQLRMLDETLVQRGSYDAVKQHRIDSLVRLSYLCEEPYEIYKKLYEEYRSYNYDKALVYAEDMAAEARESDDSQRISESVIAQAFVYLSGGLFHEAYQQLETLPEMPSGVLADEYLLTFARLLYDMCDFAGNAQASGLYSEKACGFMTQLAHRYSPADSASYWYPLAVIDMHRGNYERSISRMEQALTDSRNTLHEKAIYASSLSYLYRQTGDPETALSKAIEAAVYDCKSSTYEAVALRVVAELLYERGEFELANRYIHIAMEDANRYHARHRQVSISLLLPIIEEHHSQQSHRQAVAAYILLAIVLVLLMVCVAAIIILSYRTKAVHAARQTIDQMNQSLLEANRLKEELLGTLLTSRSQYINAVQQYQQDVKQHAVNRQWSDLLSVPKGADARLQRTVLERQLDSIILRVYPTFVQDFNALLRPEERLVLKKDELMNAQLRIFALIRLGISHNEVIAEILNYSVNTVYNYKTRVIASSDLSPEEFHAALMRIR